MLDKRAELVKMAGATTQDKLLMAAGGLGSAAIAAIGATLLHKSLDSSTNRAFKGLPRSTPALVRKLKVAAGMPALIDQEIPGLNNAYYLRPGALSNQEQDYLHGSSATALSHGNFGNHRAAQSLLRANDSPQGGIFYGPKWNNPYTVAHEMGHALSANDSALKQFLEKSPKTLNRLFSLGLVAGAATGIAKPEWIPQIGLGLAGLGGLATAATAYTESQASKKGLDLLTRAGVEPSPEGREALTLGERSHVWPKLGTHVLAPLAMAGVAKLVQRARS